MNKFASLVSGSNEDALSQIAAVAVVHRRLNKVAGGETSGSIVPTTFGEAGTLASKAIPSALANVGYLAPLGAAAMGGLSLYRESQKPKERRRYSNALVDAGIGGALGSVPWLAGHLLASDETEKPKKLKEPPKTWENLPGRLAEGGADLAGRAAAAPGQYVFGTHLPAGIAGSVGVNRLWNMFASGNGQGNAGARVRGGIDEIQDVHKANTMAPNLSEFIGQQVPNSPGLHTGGLSPDAAARAKAVEAVNTMRGNRWFANRDFALASKHGVPESGRFSATSRLIPFAHRIGTHKPPALSAEGVKAIMAQSRGSLPAGIATSKTRQRFGALLQAAPALWGLIADNNVLGTKD